MSWLQMHFSVFHLHLLNAIVTEGKAGTQRCKKRREQKVPDTEMVLGLKRLRANITFLPRCLPSIWEHQKCMTFQQLW